MGGSSSNRWLLAGIPLLFLGIFFFYPLARILVFSFLPGAVGQAAGIWDILSRGLVAKTLWFTCWQAAASTVLTLMLGLPGAYVFARFSFAGKRLLSALTTIPFVLPTVVTASAFRALLGPRGLVNTFCVDVLGFDGAPVQIDQTVWFFLLAHVFYNTTLVLRMVGGFWSNLDPRLTEAAGMLGAGRWTVFRKVTLPLLGPVIWSSALLVFTFCFTSFGVILILGGPGYATIEVEIYRQAVQLFNLPVAATLSLLQIAFSFCLLWCYTWLSRRTSIAMNTDSASRNQQRPRTLSQRLLVGGTLAFLILLLGSPLAALVVRSFTTDSGLSPAYYLALFHQQSRSVFFRPPHHRGGQLGGLRLRGHADGRSARGAGGLLSGIAKSHRRHAAGRPADDPPGRLRGDPRIRIYHYLEPAADQSPGFTGPGPPGPHRGGFSLRGPLPAAQPAPDSR